MACRRTAAESERVSASSVHRPITLAPRPLPPRHTPRPPLPPLASPFHPRRRLASPRRRPQQRRAPLPVLSPRVLLASPRGSAPPPRRAPEQTAARSPAATDSPPLPSPPLLALLAPLSCMRGRKRERRNEYQHTPVLPPCALPASHYRDSNRNLSARPESESESQL